MRRSCNINTPTFKSSLHKLQFFPFSPVTAVSDEYFVNAAASLLIHSESIYIFWWFLRLSPLCRNVYALIMNCFSARIPTELKLFNFPYFLLFFFPLKYVFFLLSISCSWMHYTLASYICVNRTSVIVSLLKFLLCDSLINFSF